MYKLTKSHHRKYIYRGDSATETAVVHTEMFKTKKAAIDWLKDYIKNNFPNCKSFDMLKEKTPQYQVFTDKSWFDEGTGNTEYEFYYFKIEKAYVR